MNILEITLGLLSALGGFVDISELVFASQAGAHFGYHLLWAVVVGVIGIIIYGEMCGRVAAIKKKAVFTLVKEKFGKTFGGVVLVASMFVNVMTCSAEIGGVAIILHLATGLPYPFLICFAGLALILIIWFFPFKWIERVFGILGLFLLVYIGVVIFFGPSLSLVGESLNPISIYLGKGDWLTYSYFAVGIMSSVLMPYEVYFYSSGGIEDGWTSKDLPINAITSVVGFSLGSLVTMSLIISGAHILLPRGISPQLLGTTTLMASNVFGLWGMILALLGMFFAVWGASIETSLSGAYNLSQYFNWKWGKSLPKNKAPQFTVTWISVIIIGSIIVLFGVDPVMITEYAVIFSAFALPFSYLPILLVAEDKKFLGKYSNNKFQSILGWIYFVIITLVGLSAIPLLFLTNAGKG